MAKRLTRRSARLPRNGNGRAVEGPVSDDGGRVRARPGEGRVAEGTWRRAAATAPPPHPPLRSSPQPLSPRARALSTHVLPARPCARRLILFLVFSIDSGVQSRADQVNFDSGRDKTFFHFQLVRVHVTCHMYWLLINFENCEEGFLRYSTRQRASCAFAFFLFFNSLRLRVMSPP